MVPTAQNTRLTGYQSFPAQWAARRLFSGLTGLLFLLLIAGSLISPQVRAATGSWVETPQAKARLLIASGMADGQLKGGLELILEDGWKTYWRTPGAAGIPPQIRPTDDSAVAEVTLHYPAPLRLDFQGLQLYGYEKRVIFPLDLALKPDAKDRDIELDARLLICRELCIPASFKTRIRNVDLTAQFNGVTDADAAFAINQFSSQIPRSAEDVGISAAQIQLDENQKLLEIQLRLPAEMELLDLFPELQPEPELDAPILAAPIAQESDQQQLWRAQIPVQRKRMPSSDEAANLVIRTQQGAFELPLHWQPLNQPLERLQGKVISGHKSSLASEAEGASLWLMLLMALIGGAILNLMPCVLPVLSIKVIHLLKHSELSRRQVRLSFIATASGIISTFLLLAAVLLALRASGQAVGWGIQFQQPLFIAALAIIVVVFAGNLWGLFEFRLPAFFSSMGADTQNQHSLSTSFAQGALATLLATPCSAPFLGTAIGFAFSQNDLTMLLIFLSLGIGLALPYLLMTLKPEWVYKLPKPGRWMLTLKRIMGLGLLLTAFWLFWVLADLLLLTAVLAIASLGLLWWLFVRQQPLSWILPVLAIALVPFMPQPELGSSVEAAGDSDDQLNWVAFEPERIAEYVAKNQVVFVDITARWCVTCVANKVAVINTPTIQAALSEPGILPMLGDWTRPDSRISDFLNQHQRFGIPFNAVYGPGAPEGILLSEILTQEALLAALKQAKGPAQQ